MTHTFKPREQCESNSNNSCGSNIGNFDFLSCGGVVAAAVVAAAEVVAAGEAGRDIIWDQTSTTQASRAKKLRMLPDYWPIAVVFATPAVAVLKKRLDNRPGKDIPWEVVKGMIDNFEYPTTDEGFKEIWRV